MNIEDTAIKNSSQEAFWPWIWVVIFAAAFAWVESAVVVYLREIYFNGSFEFPIVTVWVDGKRVFDELGRIEFGREAATIIMLAALSWASGRNALQKVCFFIIAFGVWDVFYYLWLRVMIGWPENLMTWDLLFFIPLPWVSPVITPILIALAMTIAGSLMIFYDNKGYLINWRWYDWTIELFCGLLMVTAFCWDWKNIIRFPDGVPRDGLPNPFAWWLYLPAYIFSVIYFAFRLRQFVSTGR
ncbi:MAG: hypothetical protein JRF41_12970, partial [Deltaproteobacteria bacterium]|nr:hypothetical protein [Deltaproteobacteria bacterium]